jgi:hypothetical protein
MANLRTMLRPRSVALAVVAVLVIIQFKPVTRDNPPIQNEIGASPEIMAILDRACYDCHSNETEWPWYSHVAPISWFVTDHVAEAREHLNFSEWPEFDMEEQEHLFEEMEEEVEDEEMPLKSYLMLHREARLTPDDREVLLRWVRADP